MQTILAGGIFVPERLRQAGMIENSTCKHCGHHTCDEYHLYYDCPEVNKDPELNSTIDIKQRIGTHFDMCPCLPYRAIMPHELTTHEVKEAQHRRIPGIPQPEPLLKKYKHIFTDGSGGEEDTHQDTRLRRVGWSWVAFEKEELIPVSYTHLRAHETR